MPNSRQASPIDGKYVILAVFAIGLIGAAGGWWYHRSAQRRVLEFWGSEAAELIVIAPRVEAIHLAPAAAGEHVEHEVQLGESRFDVIERVDVSGAAGLIHLRQGLFHDGSFDWSKAEDDCRPQWDYALRFSENERSVTVLVAFNCPRLKLAGKTREAAMGSLARGLEQFLKEQFDQAERASKP
jgi:hypothetical protein